MTRENDMMKENEEQEGDQEDGDRRVVELTPKRRYWEVKLGEESDEEDRIVIKLRRPKGTIRSLFRVDVTSRFYEKSSSGQLQHVRSTCDSTFFNQELE